MLVSTSRTSQRHVGVGNSIGPTKRRLPFGWWRQCVLLVLVLLGLFTSLKYAILSVPDDTPELFHQTGHDDDGDDDTNVATSAPLAKDFSSWNDLPQVLLPLQDERSLDHKQSTGNNVEDQTTTTIAAASPSTTPAETTTSSIRRWGCSRRHEAPLIFIHIGKSGGGNVRARLAAAAVDYNRTEWFHIDQDQSYYYPILQQQQLHKGILVNSFFPNYHPTHLPLGLNNSSTNRNVTAGPLTATMATNTLFHPPDPHRFWQSYEKTLPCAARTPLGQAVACPGVHWYHDNPALNRACSGERCDIVYVGHNWLGNELHWLPTAYLEQWWNRTRWATLPSSSIPNRSVSSSAGIDAIVQHFRHRRSTLWSTTSLPSGGDPCQLLKKRWFRYYEQRYHDCIAPWEAMVDRDAHRAVLQGSSPHGSDQRTSTAFTNSASLVTDWSPVYASLPVLRITILREPWNWLVSKYLWHYKFRPGRYGTHLNLTACDNGYYRRSEKPLLEPVAEWISVAALKYIWFLCGEECAVRMSRPNIDGDGMTLEQAERQARHNLQQSIAVVGLLNETNTFYDMITARVAYLNTSSNTQVEGNPHSTTSSGAASLCRRIFQRPDFQRMIRSMSPEVVALERLYRVGVDVNRFQLHEMRSCGVFP